MSKHNVEPLLQCLFALSGHLHMQTDKLFGLYSSDHAFFVHIPKIEARTANDVSETGGEAHTAAGLPVALGVMSV